jgi:hypothetical protein
MLTDAVIQTATEAFLEESAKRKEMFAGKPKDLLAFSLLAALEAAAEHFPSNKAVEDVLAIHCKVQNRDEDGDIVPGSHCAECKDVDEGELVYEIYPCLTVREITAALEGRQTHTDMRRAIEGMVK